MVFPDDAHSHIRGEILVGGIDVIKVDHNQRDIHLRGCSNFIGSGMIGQVMPVYPSGESQCDQQNVYLHFSLVFLLALSLSVSGQGVTNHRSIKIDIKCLRVQYGNRTKQVRLNNG